MTTPLLSLEQRHRILQLVGERHRRRLPWSPARVVRPARRPTNAQAGLAVLPEQADTENRVGAELVERVFRNPALDRPAGCSNVRSSIT
jgi:hypothetical protein